MKSRERTSRLIQRRATSFFEFGLPLPPWMAYTFAKNLVMMALLTLILGVLAASSLNAQTDDQKKNLNDRLEAAWKAKSPEAFEALYWKHDADQYLVDARVSWWTHNWNVGPEPEMKIVRFVSMAELEKLADPKNSDPNQTRYQEALEDITKPKIMNRNSYVQNLPVAGILEVDVIQGKLTRHDRVVVGISPDGTLLFTLLKRSEQDAALKVQE